MKLDKKIDKLIHELNEIKYFELTEYEAELINQVLELGEQVFNEIEQ